MKINFFHTYISDSASVKVNEVLQSTFISEGQLVQEFESQLSSKLGLLNPVTVNSGTSALHLALVVAGIKAGDEVICPAQTFVASATAIMQVGATPVFADIQYETGNICPKSIETKISDKTKVIMPVHWGGYPCDLEEIHNIAQKYDLIVIEDAAHALGSTYKESPIGTLSDFTCFSFQAIKHLTTGDGGAICCLNSIDKNTAVIKRWFGIDRKSSTLSPLGERQYDIQELGYKYHLNDYAAALGLANLEGFKERLTQRRIYAQMYSSSLNNIPGINLFRYKKDRESAFWLYGFHVEKRDDFMTALQSRGVPTSVVHQRIDRNSLFGGLNTDLLNQVRFDNTQVHIPIHDGLTEEMVQYVIDSIKQGW